VSFDYTNIGTGKDASFVMADVMINYILHQTTHWMFDRFNLHIRAR